MVCLSAQRDKLSARSSMAVPPDRTTALTPAGKPLHNFDMPWLRWGSQRYLRCMKLKNSGSDNLSDEIHRRSDGLGLEIAPIATHRRDSRRRKVEDEDNGDGIAAVREKLLGDLKVAAAKLKDAIFREGVSEDEDVEESDARPWNLRTRRAAACKAPAAEDGKVVISSSSSPEKTRKREKFTLGLSKKEIDSDFMSLVGHKPARRPKKRPRNVQRQLDFLLPGLFLTEITADSYKVPENPETGKR